MNRVIALRYIVDGPHNYAPGDVITGWDKARIAYESTKEIPTVRVEADIDEPEESDLSELTVAELRQMARDGDITGYSSMRKDDLIEAIEEAD